MELTDIGAITEHTHVGFFKFLLAFTVLFILFGFAWWEVRRLQDRTILWIILCFSTIFVLTTIFVYPITAIDIFVYITHGLVLVQYHANPMITPPSVFAHDPLMKLAGGFITAPSPYGPLDLLIQALPIAVAGRNIFLSLLLLKCMFSAILIIQAFFIHKILSHIAPKFALPAILALAWNPFTILEYSANGHNDIAMTLFIILAIFALVKEHHIWALTLITASALIKFSSLPLLPLFFIYSFTHHPTHKKRMLYAIKSTIALLGLILAIFGPFWAGPQTLGYLRTITQTQLYSFSMFLQDFSSGRISFNQATAIGWNLFGACFLYASWLASKDLSQMLKGCLLTMFALLAFSATYIQVWYLIWPFVLAILIPQTEVSLAAIFLLYAGTLVELIHAYIFPWGTFGIPSAFAIVNSTAYLIIFFPPVLFLLVYRFRYILSQSPNYSYKEKNLDPLSP
ncbi:MAG TPA: hypothetical protein VGL94_23680 [Ktedonobacteraceae bacterium]|jgi:hypothetical protein